VTDVLTLLDRGGGEACTRRVYTHIYTHTHIHIHTHTRTHTHTHTRKVYVMYRWTMVTKPLILYVNIAVYFVYIYTKK
jgi:hypothetical protein